jgi:cytochrome P450
VLTAFWATFHIFSDPQVLAKVQDQVEFISCTETTEDGTRRVSKINLRRLKDAPILFSVIQEALRHRAIGTGPRMVMDDTTIGSNQYHLKKKSVLIIANKALHLDKEA